jgi:hypothetical protein
MRIYFFYFPIFIPEKLWLNLQGEALCSLLENCFSLGNCFSKKALALDGRMAPQTFFVCVYCQLGNLKSITHTETKS